MSFDTENTGKKLALMGPAFFGETVYPQVICNGKRVEIERTLSKDFLTELKNGRNNIICVYWIGNDKTVDSGKLSNFQISINKKSSDTYGPYISGGEIMSPCDLYEGDTWWPMSGKVLKSDGSVEQYPTQPVFTPQGTVNVLQEPVELPGILSATVLIKR